MCSLERVAPPEATKDMESGAAPQLPAADEFWPDVEEARGGYVPDG